MAIMQVLAINDKGQPEIKKMNDRGGSRIDELIPVFSSSLTNWQFARQSTDERFNRYGDTNLECALLCMNCILAIIEEEGTDQDKAELQNFLKSFTS